MTTAEYWTLDVQKFAVILRVSYMRSIQRLMSQADHGERARRALQRVAEGAAAKQGFLLGPFYEAGARQDFETERWTMLGTFFAVQAIPEDMPRELAHSVLNSDRPGPMPHQLFVMKPAKLLHT